MLKGSCSFKNALEKQTSKCYYMYSNRHISCYDIYNITGESGKKLHYITRYLYQSIQEIKGMKLCLSEHSPFTLTKQ